MTYKKRIIGYLHYFSRLPRRITYALPIVAAFILLGIIGIQASKAATSVAFSDAEIGTIAGNTAKITDPAASGGQAVKFGAVVTQPVAAPYRVQALTGGNSIAIVWTASSSKVQNYEVYRNDAKIATVTPGSGFLTVEKEGRTYIDKAVTAGTSYTYKVKAVAADGTSSPLTSANTVTHPRTSTPVPTVIFDTSLGGNDLLSYLQTYIKPHLETWYPKISDALAYPDFIPSNTIRIKMDPSVALANSPWGQGLINVNPDWLRTNQQNASEGMFLHEATHTVQTYLRGDPSPWATEGIADWTRDWFTLERVHIPKLNAQLSQHYSESAHMLKWAETKYSPGLIRKVNLAVNKGTYTTSFFTSLTGGRTAEQLYAEAKSQYYGGTGAVAGTNGACMDVANSSTDFGAKLQLFACNNSNAQKWTTVYRDAGLHGNTKNILHIVNYALLADGRCLDVVSAGTTSGIKVQSWGCNFGEAQKWTRGPNSSLINPNSGKCLATTGNGSENGNQLIISDCNGSSGQRWTVPQ